MSSCRRGRLPSMLASCPNRPNIGSPLLGVLRRVAIQLRRGRGALGGCCLSAVKVLIHPDNLCPKNLDPSFDDRHLFGRLAQAPDPHQSALLGGGGCLGGVVPQSRLRAADLDANSPALAGQFVESTLDPFEASLVLTVLPL